MPGTKVTRRGFSNRKYPVPPIILYAAKAQLAKLPEILGYTPERMHVTLRVATYCGPGSAGDRGCYMLDVYTGGPHHTNGHFLYVVTPEGGVH